MALNHVLHDGNRAFHHDFQTSHVIRNSAMNAQDGFVVSPSLPLPIYTIRLPD